MDPAGILCCRHCFVCSSLSFGCQSCVAALLLGHVLQNGYENIQTRPLPAAGTLHSRLPCHPLHLFHVSLHCQRIQLTWNELKNQGKKTPPAFLTLCPVFICSLLPLNSFIFGCTTAVWPKLVLKT